MNNYFYLWVANTILELGGNPGQYLCGVGREWLLTSVQSRTSACQGGSENYFDEQNLDFMRDSAVVTTNKRVLH